MGYGADENRYRKMVYNRCGRSGLLLSAFSLGYWHGFGGRDSFENGREITRKSFDLGITSFDLANNYGPPAGSAEDVFGRIMKLDMMPYRDEMIISTKAGYEMWPGPYGGFGGSKKYLMASLDQSLKRMGLDYVDIFYHHCMDPDTPMEETAEALAYAVTSGKALYAGVSNYTGEGIRKMERLLGQRGIHCLLVQPLYNMFTRDAEKDGVFEAMSELGIGGIAYSPLAQGLLSGKYNHSIPENSRAAGESIFLQKDAVTEEKICKVKALEHLARERGQTMAQMALAWVLRRPEVTTVLIGASCARQIEENLAALERLSFTEEELRRIDVILKGDEVYADI